VAGGPYAIALGTLTANGNYAISFTGSTLAITPATLTITASARSKPYGSVLALNGASDFTAAGLLNSETIGSVTLTASGSPAGTATNAAVGAYTITPSAATGGTFTPANYAINYTNGTLTVNKAALSVTADAKTKVYGAVDPAFTVAYTGFVNGETSAVLGGTLAFGRAPGENVGSYLITPNGLTSANYTITFNTGSLGITKAVLSVTANPLTKTYGAVDPALTFVVSGLQFSDTSGTVLAGALTRVADETVAGGPYAISQGTLTPDGNYTISFTGNTLAITKAALSVTADAKTKVYGAVDPAFTATDSGFVNGETAAVLGGTLAFNRAPGENFGSYLITPSGLTSGNYAITFNTGSLGITKAALAVTADVKSKTFGTTDPVFTAAYAGFVNSETPAVLGGTLTFTRVPGETVGAYLITPSGLTSANYAIAFNTGTLTITAPAPLLLPLTRVGTTNIVITWSAVSNATYRVQYNPVLNTTNWTDLFGDVIATGSMATKTDAMTTTNRFYRVRVVP
jgi:putative NADPH-quinone reductase